MPAALPSDSVPELRRQLILAQVQLLELEDVRDELETRLSERERLLSGLQGQTDLANEEADHLKKVHADLERHRDHLQHLLHVANQALDQTRAEVQRLSADLAAAGDRERELRSHVAGLEMQAAGLRAEIARLEERGRELDRGLADALAVSAARQKRLEELDAEVRRMKASRSWRWTAWLRSLERFFSRR